jgi:hypothetical protein
VLFVAEYTRAGQVYASVGVAPGVSCPPCRDALRFLPLSYSLQPATSGPACAGAGPAGEFLRNSGFLCQQRDVEKRLYMVK